MKPFEKIAFFRLFSFGLFVASVLPITPASAFNLGIEPVAGYQLQKRNDPDRTTKTLTYGLRLSAGITLLSLEAEANRGKSDESFADRDLTIKEETDRYRLGLRSDISLGMISYFRLRGGAEGRKITTDRTQRGVSTHNVSPTKVYPYVGAGLGMMIAPKTRVTAEVTMTIIDQKNLKNNDIAPSVSISVGI